MLLDELKNELKRIERFERGREALLWVTDLSGVSKQSVVDATDRMPFIDGDQLIFNVSGSSVCKVPVDKIKSVRVATLNDVSDDIEKGLLLPLTTAYQMRETFRQTMAMHEA